MSDLHQQLDAFKSQVDKWEKELGLFEPGVDLAEVEKALGANREKLTDMSPAEAAEWAVILSQFGFSLQYHENRCRAFIQWTDGRKSLMRGDDLVQVNRLTQNANQKITRIAYMTRRIENMSQCLMSLQRAKEKEQA